MEQGVAALERIAVGEVDHEGEARLQARRAVVHAVLMEVELLPGAIAAKAEALVHAVQPPGLARVVQRGRRVPRQAFQHVPRQLRVVHHLAVVVAVGRRVVAAGAGKAPRFALCDVLAAFLGRQEVGDDDAEGGAFRQGVEGGGHGGGCLKWVD
jgi:hypothetical protein